MAGLWDERLRGKRPYRSDSNFAVLFAWYYPTVPRRVICSLRLAPTSPCNTVAHRDERSRSQRNASATMRDKLFRRGVQPRVSRRRLASAITLGTSPGRRGPSRWRSGAPICLSTSAITCRTENPLEYPQLKVTDRPVARRCLYTARCKVLRGIVGTIHDQLVATADRHLSTHLNQMSCVRGRLPGPSHRICARNIEVAQIGMHQTVRAPYISQYRLEH